MDLNPEVEEICNWWAQVLETDFASKELVIKNFTESFLALFDKSLGATSLDDFDFSAIKQHLEKQREIRLARSTEDKKREQAEKAEADAKFKTCLYNNRVEKVSNFIVEPPGIFRGRGEARGNRQR